MPPYLFFRCFPLRGSDYSRLALFFALRRRNLGYAMGFVKGNVLAKQAALFYTGPDRTQILTVGCARVLQPRRTLEWKGV